MFERICSILYMAKNYELSLQPARKIQIVKNYENI